jgi:hypothetical protein
MCESLLLETKWKGAYRLICPTCDKTVLFGGVKDGNKKYCSKECIEKAEINKVAEKIPDDDVDKMTNKIRNDRCPVCRRKKIIDVHKSYSVFSLFFFTNYETRQHMMCKSCAIKRQLLALLSSSLFGWWGFPFGLIMTPVQIIRNIFELFVNPGKNGPTALMTQNIRQLIAVEQIENHSERP